jgi:hypothetical protein
MPELSITPIDRDHLDEVARFLHENLNRRFTPQAWKAALLHPWSASPPNFGMQLRDGNSLVGVFCAIYSDQDIAGKTERFCNPHSWCVLKVYRQHGIGLILNVLKQRGYHFTMLTPNPKVAEIFRQLRFKDLAAGMVTFPNIPGPRAFARGSVLESDAGTIEALLIGSTRRDFIMHREIPWLRFIAFGMPNDLCLIVYKRTVWKRLPCARLIHVSDPDAFDRNRGLMQRHLLMKERLLVSQIEERFLHRIPSPAWRSRRTQAKLYLSETLQDAQIRDLYSELAALDV